MKQLSYFEEQYNSACAARDKASVKALGCLLVAILMTVLTVLGINKIPMAILQLAACALTVFLCRADFLDGLKSFLKLNPSPYCYYSFALIATAIHSVYLLATPKPAEDQFFSAALFLSLAISAGLKYLYAFQVVRNLDLVRDKKTYALQVTDLSLSKKYIRQVCSANPVIDFPNVVRTSSDGDPSDGKNRRFVPWVILGVIVASIIVAILRKGTFIPALTILLIMCATFTAEGTFILPYVIMQLRLRHMGSILLGNYSVKHLKDADTLLVKDTDLFPPDRNEILHFRVKNTARAAEATKYIAALLALSESPLLEAFRKQVPDLPERSPTVLQWRVIKNYGIVATVDLDNVLLGNRNLLLSHNVQPWSPEKEAMLSAAGVHLIYLVINRTITATMICRYGEDPALKKAADMPDGEFHLLVDTKDCNINESMIQRRYDLPHTKISVPDPDEAESVDETREELEEDQSPPVMISTQNALGITEAIRRTKILYKRISVSFYLQQISILFGLLLTVAALIFAPGKMVWLWPLAYHLIWLIPVPLIALFYKK